MPQLSGRDYPLAPTPQPTAMSQASSSDGIFGSRERRQERRAERQTNRAVRQSNRSMRCGRRGCPGQGSGMGFGGY